MKKILIFLSLSLASMSVNADMALKFFGTATGGELSELATAAAAKASPADEGGQAETGSDEQG